MRVIKSFEDAKALEGEEIGLSDWVVIDQNRIDQFAEATGDHQWIHVDTERAAKEMPDGQTIAHGYLTLALVPALSANFIEFENLARAINFGANKVRFYTPVPVGARVRARAAILQARHRGGALMLSSEVKIEVEVHVFQAFVKLLHPFLEAAAEQEPIPRRPGARCRWVHRSG